MYKILDSYGARKTARTWHEALAWLAACSPDAKIVGRFTGRLIATRKFGSAA